MSAPEIFPGIAGLSLTIDLQRAGETIPQTEVAVTQIVPTLNPDPIETVTEFVP